MNGNYFVSVLLPNRRRKKTPVSKKVPIFQVLDEICKKNGLSSDNYTFKFHNKLLDISSTLEYSGIPNNAELELEPLLFPRVFTPINIIVQLGEERRSDMFPCSSTLWDVIQKLYSKEVEENQNVSLVYTCARFSGERLSTHLKMFGLTKGSMSFRLVFEEPKNDSKRSSQELIFDVSPPPDEIDTSDDLLFNVSPPAGMDTLQKLKFNESPPEGMDILTEPTQDGMDILMEPSQDKMDILTEPPRDETNILMEPPRDETDILMEPSQNKMDILTVQPLDGRNILTEPPRDGTNILTDPPRDETDILTERGEQVEAINELLVSTAKDEKANKKSDSTASNVSKPSNLKPSDITYLDDERRALIYNRDDAIGLRFEEPDDEFFNVTEEDAKKLLNDAQRITLELQNRQFQTSIQREEIQRERVNELKEKYPECVVRVLMPGGYVLQCVFKTTDTIAHVRNYIRRYLRNCDMEFYLFTCPPKTVLADDKTLLEMGAIPAIMVHFGTTTNGEPFLKAEFLEKRVPYYMAELASDLARNRSADRQKNSSLSNAQQSSTTKSQVDKKTSNVIPKWFQR